MIKHPLLWSALVTTALLQLSCKPPTRTAPPTEAKTTATSPLEPVMMADFAEGKPQWSTAPGEKRLGWFYLTGPRKDPYSSFEGKRFSILECMESDPKRGQTVLVLKNDMSTDILGAFNLSSGTVAAWVRPGHLLKKGGSLLSLPSTFPGSPQRGPMAWELKTEVAEGEGPRWVLTHALSGMSRRSAAMDAPTDAEDWLHVAVVWDVRSGVQLYLDGKLLPSEEMADGPAVRRDGETWPLERLRLHSDPARALSQLAIYDQPLDAAGIGALYRGEPVRQTMLQAGDTPRNRPGWSDAPIEQFIATKAGEAIRLVQATVLDAREEGRRAGGWLAVDGAKGSAFPWWYHGYKQVSERELVVTLEPDSRPDYVTGSGDFNGTLGVSGATGADVALGGDQPWFGIALGKAAGAASYTVRQFKSKGLLEEIAFYRVEKQAASPEGALRLVPITAKTPPALHSPLKQRELASRYHSRQPLETWHLVSAREAADFALGEVGLKLALGTLENPVRAKVVVHDPLSPWRDLAELHLVLEPGTGERTIWLDLRDTVIPKGEQVWVSVALDQAVVLQPGQSDGSGSQLLLAPAQDAEKALALWRQWEWRTVRDHLEAISEPRPWSTITGDEENAWWLRLFTPAYDGLDRGVRRLLAYFPQDPLFAATFAFTHPQAELAFSALPVPGESDAPRWAVLMKENLRLYRQFVDWWIDHRQHANGEFGHWYGDDTDLLQEWVNLAFITDPQGKYQASFTRLATALATEFRQRGLPITANGLNTRYTDSLHAYEEGLNLQSPDFLLHYGDPVRFQRLLDTVARYDGFLLTAPDENGHRRFTGTKRSGELLFFNTERPPEGGYLDKYGYLFLQPGLVVGWYGNDPATWNLLESVARWSLTRTQADDAGWKSIGMTLLHGMYLQSGAFSWLEPAIDSNAWASGVLLPTEGNSPTLYPTLYPRVAGLDAAATLKAVEEKAQGYDFLGSPMLGDGDHRFAQSWVAWKLSGSDEKRLLPALEALYRKLSFLMPVVTEAEMSGDRVAVPKDLLSLLYLGGSPTARNCYFYPDFAVSYEGLNDQFAAIVQEAGGKKLKLMFYNFEEKPQQGRLRTWALEEGDYEITEGAQGSDGKFIAPTTRILPLARGDGLELVLPSRSVHVMEIRQLKQAAIETVRGDAALAKDRAKYEAGGVTLPIYNLGSLPLKGVVVRLLSAEGATVSEKVVAELPGMAQWKLGEAEVAFELPPAAPGSRYRIVIDPDRRLSEITRRNNELTLQPPATSVEAHAKVRE